PGEFWTTRNVATQNTSTMPAGGKNRHCQGGATTAGGVISTNTPARPLWIIDPQKAGERPPSAAGDQPAVNMVGRRAVCDWKEQFSVHVVAKNPRSSVPVPTTPTYAPRPNARLKIHAPQAPMSMARRPPRRSAIGPLNTADRP